MLDEILQHSREISSNYPELLHCEDVTIRKSKFTGGRLDRYLQSAFLTETLDIPVLYIGNSLFMSITPMEIESHINPIKWAEGHVLIAGLGMGYYLQEILKKDEVTKVTVVEASSTIIEVYNQMFDPDERVEFVCEDIFNHTHNEVYDYAYYDIWAHMDFDEMKDVFDELVQLVDAKRYTFWGLEKFISDSMNLLLGEGYEADEMRDRVMSEFDIDIDWCWKDTIDLIQKIAY